MCTVGQRIKHLRQVAGVAQVDLASYIGVSKQTLYKYENDIITNIPSDKIELVAKRFDVSPADLMGWNDPAPASLSPDEEELLTGYRRLNEPGQKQLRKQLTMMLHDEDYARSEKETLNAG